VVTVWFPSQERGRATGWYVSAQYIGTGLCTPLLFWIAYTFGWRPIFYVTGLVGLAFAAVWWLLYRDPHESRTVNAGELEALGAGGAVLDGGVKQAFRWSEVWQLFEHRQIWAICIGKFAISVSIFFLLTWFPTYLVQARGLSVLKAGYYAMAPFLCSAVGVLCGGLWSDLMLKRGFSLTAARKAPIVTGFLLTSSIFLANFTHTNLQTVAVIGFAFFCQGVSSMGWAVTAEVAPVKLVGITGGVVNFFANLAGIVTPIAIGFIVKGTGSYYGALGLVAAAGLLGCFAYTVVLGEVRRIELRPAPARDAP
jgi:ACS family D-galactonate transporter-like MFS transporter